MDWRVVVNKTNEYFDTVAARNANQNRMATGSRLIEAGKDPQFSGEEFVTCATCRGHKYLFVHSEEFPDDPPQRVYCCSCMGVGVDTRD